MSLSLLPSVLMQTVMHWLHPRQRISLARCSRWTMQCADAAFPWLHCPPLSQSLWKFRPPVAPSRLRRWIPLMLGSPEGYDLIDSDAERILELAPSSRIVGLDWAHFDLSVGLTTRLLSAPSMRWLEAVGGQSECSDELMTALASLPSLTALKLYQSSLLDVREMLSRFIDHPSLRSLHLLCDAQDDSGILSVVMRMPRIRALHLNTPPLYSANFVSFCVAMPHLTELSIEWWQADSLKSISDLDLATGFRSLRSLRKLTFLGGWGEDKREEESLIPLLHHLPALRELTIPFTVPLTDPARLASLLTAAPQLRLQLSRVFEGREPDHEARRILITPFAERISIS